MESTSIYWLPIWHVLEADFSLTLTNPYFIKQLPDRKSDVKEAQWIVECLQKDLIKSSFVLNHLYEITKSADYHYKKNFGNYLQCVENKTTI